MTRNQPHFAGRLALALPLLLGLSCSGQPTDATNQVGETPLLMQANVAATTIEILVVDVTASDITTPPVYNLLVVDGVASGTIVIPVGSDRIVMVLDANGDPTGDVVTWATSNPGVASVDANGLVTANAEGSAEIVATCNGVGGSASVTVGGAGPPDDDLAYVANLNSTVSVIETAGNTVVATIDVGTGPIGVAIAP